jgi:hypothetical protein
MMERVHRFIPVQTVETIFLYRSFFIKSMEQKDIMECSNLPGIVAYAASPLMARWTAGLYKSSFITKDEHDVCQLTRTKVQQNIGK